MVTGHRAIALALAFAPLVATAQPARTPPPELARAHAEAARRHFEAKEYGRAAVELEAALRFDPRPPYVYALGQAQRLAGDCGSAIRSYRQFLATSPPARQAEAARENVSRCEAELKARAPSPPAVAAAPVSPPAVAPPPPPRRPWYTDALGDSLTGAGLAVAVAGTVVWALGRSAAAKANAAATYDAYLADADGAATMQRAGVAVLSVGAALIAAGVVRFVLRPARRAERLAVTAAPGPGGAALLCAGRF